MKILFFGTQEWSAEVLRHLIADDFFEIVHVVTQPDQPVGRKHVLTASPVKHVAMNASISILQPTDLKDPMFLRIIKDADAELAVIIAYGRIVPAELLSMTKCGFVNVHPSLLPKWRGPSPIQAAIAAGDEKTGISIMLIDAKMDHGPLLSQTEFSLSQDSSFTNVMENVNQKAPQFLIQTIKDFVSNKITPQPQDHSLATYCKLLKRDDGRIDWNRSAAEIERMVRAYEPWPGSWTMAMLDGRPMRLKLLKVKAWEEVQNKTPGELFRKENSLFVGTTKGVLELLVIQPEGKKALSVADFLSGYKQMTLENLHG